MQNNKHFYTFLIFIIIFLMFSFYKNVLKREKVLKQQNEEDIRYRIQDQLKDNERFIELEETRKNLKILKQRNFLNKWLEYKDKCYAIHALVERPPPLSIDNLNKILTDDNQKSKLFDKEKLNNYDNQKSRLSIGTGPIIYIFLSVLLGSLIKAFADLSSQLKKKSEEEANGSRRCSLQEYANMAKKNERRNSKTPFIRRAATISTLSTRAGSFSKSFEEQRNSIVPRITELPTPPNSGLNSETGTPKKIAINMINNGIAGRPPPLLRRCSVPTFAQHQMAGQQKIRRPSFDSFSEDDSSPEMKRRVRMIHRH